MSLRGLRVLIEGLPPDSAMHRKYPQSRGWDHREYMIAELLDWIQRLHNVTLAANSEDGMIPPIDPYVRPGDAERRAAEERRRARRGASMRSLLAQLLPPERR